MRLPEPVDARGHDRDAFLSNTLEDQPLWSGLYENLRDRFFPPSLPPLELTSTPVPVPDRMAANTNPWAVGTATVVNGGILALLLLAGVRAVLPPSSRPAPDTKFNLSEFPLFVPAKLASPNSGSGGGVNDPIEPNKGHLPKLDMNAVEPVQVPLLDHPKLAIDNSIALPPDVKLPENPTMPMIGVHNSANVTLLSGGSGGPFGIGTGLHGGYGPGSGSGWGPGSDAGIYTPGVGDVSQPIPILTPEAEFSDEARRQKFQGVCVISVIIDAQGNPQNPRVVQPLGFGLDQKALEAVQKYKFKPARKDGKPVAVRMSVMVNFRLY